MATTKKTKSDGKGKIQKKAATIADLQERIEFLEKSALEMCDGIEDIYKTIKWIVQGVRDGVKKEREDYDKLFDAIADRMDDLGRTVFFDHLMLWSHMGSKQDASFIDDTAKNCRIILDDKNRLFSQGLMRLAATGGAPGAVLSCHNKSN